MKRALPIGLAAILLTALPLQAVSAMRHWAPTADELAHHVASGYSYWKTGDFRMNPASPPLPRMLTALPLLFLGARAPLDHPSWREGNSPVFAQQFFYVANSQPERFILWARLPVVLLSMLFGLVVCLAAWRWFGAAGGLTALALYVFCPDVLAHSSLATADLAAAFFFLLTLLAFIRYLRAPSRGRAALAGVCAGLMFLSKFSAIVLFPVLFLTAWAAGRLRTLTPGRAGIFLVVLLMTVWAGYGFELKPLLENTPDPAKKAAVYESVGGPAFLRFAETVPVPLSTFSSALVSMMVTRARGTHAFLMGQWSDYGWWYYYYVAFAVKNTIAFLVLALAGWLMQLGAWKQDRLRVAALTVPVVFFFLATMGDRAQAGIRYFLPVYPLFMIAAGGLGAWLWKKGVGARTALIVLLTAHAVSSFSVRPDYLAYFNEAAGGPSNGWRVLRDSNLDWGQDLKRLGEEVRRRGSPEVVLLYPWPADPDAYGIRWRPFMPEEKERPQNHLYAVSAQVIDAVVWARGREPDAFIGRTIFVYDLRNEPV